MHDVSFSAMVDNLINRTFAWENARNKPFLYDGV
jgi:protein regulator of cytokinesis 1